MTNKIVLIYSYYNRPSSNFNLAFFLKHLRDNIDYIFVINGYESPITFPQRENVLIMRRENAGFDFGAHKTALEFLDMQNKKYEYYFFMNCGVFGPILPHYIKDLDWTQVFISKLKGKVKLVGTSILSVGWHPDPNKNFPAVETFFFLTDYEGLQLLQKEKTVFAIYENKDNTAHTSEYGASLCMFKNGYTIDCILRKYEGVDWTDRNQWKNYGLPISRPGYYYGGSILPYEVIFHKWAWTGEAQFVHIDTIDDYNRDFN